MKIPSMTVALMFALVIIIIAGCITPGSSSVKADVYPSLSQQFSLKMNQSAYLPQERLLVRFLGVNWDSRCPAGVQCIWAGNVNISLELREGTDANSAGALSDISMVMDAGGEPTVKVANSFGNESYSIKLLAVNPYPQMNQTKDERDYSITLVVTKNP